MNATSETEEKEKSKLDLSMAGLAAGVVATVAMSWLGSFLGAFGTLVGAGLTSVVYTVITTITKHGFERTGAKLKTVAAKGEIRVPIKKPPLKRRHWIIAGCSAAGIFVVVMGVNTVVEAAASKPVAAIVQGKQGSGTTLGGGHVDPQPATTTVPTPLSTRGSTSTTVPRTGVPTQTPPVLLTQTAYPTYVPSEPPTTIPSATPHFRQSPPPTEQPPVPTVPVPGVSDE